LSVTALIWLWAGGLLACRHGYSVFYITGRPQSQTAATIKDLTSAGYAAPQPGHLFLKPAAPPSYLHCANPSDCTTTEYKSGTRKYISSLGYSIVADFATSTATCSAATPATSPPRQRRAARAPRAGRRSLGDPG
jgi:hypothetical protein